MPEREIYSGMAETIKHACLADREFFEYLEHNMDKVLACDSDVCEHIAECNCNIKYHVVMKDERESGLREVPVSYTHLDVYKRQVFNNAIFNS